MSLMGGMLAIQSMSSCVTLSHVYYDEGRGRSKDIYCEYKGKRILPGETYRKSKDETCECDKDGLKCCKKKKTRKQSGDYGPGEQHLDFHGRHMDMPSGFSGKPWIKSGSSVFDEHGMGLADQIPYGDFGFPEPSSRRGERRRSRNKKSRKKSGLHGMGGLYDMPFEDHRFAGPSSRRGGRERDGPRLHSAVDPFDFPLFK